MYLLVYYCATGFKDLHIINNKGRGSPLSTLNNFANLKNKVYSFRDVFLDNVTGDYYSFKPVIVKYYFRKYKNGFPQEMLEFIIQRPLYLKVTEI